MKIAVVTRYFPSSAEPWQGRSAYQTLRILAQNAVVQVFYANAKYPSLLKPRTRIYDKLDVNYQPPDVPVSYYDYLALPLISRPFNGRATANLLLPHVRAFAPDLIFSIFLYPDGYAAVQIGKKLGVPVVAMSIGSDINSIGDFVSARLTRTVLHEVDAVVTVSDDLRKKAVVMGAKSEKARAVINGCDLTIFHPADRAEARRRLNIDTNAETVIYIGRMDVKKGLRELVEAAIALHPKRPKLQVYMVGVGPDRPLLEAQIQAANAGAYIHLMPGCAPNDVAVWMTAADVVTLPSYMEGCPNVVLEALACGRPVVAANVGGIPEIMSDACGRLIPPQDSSALAAALAAVLNSPWDAAAISASWGRSWAVVADELRSIFDTLVAQQQGLGA